MLLFTIFSLATAAAGPPVATPDRRAPVNVHVNGDTGVDSRLQDALERAISRHSRLRLATAGDEGAEITIETESNVGVDRLDGVNILTFIAYVHRGNERGAPEVGVCYERRISKCVSDLLRWAEIEAERP